MTNSEKEEKLHKIQEAIFIYQFRLLSQCPWKDFYLSRIKKLEDMRDRTEKTKATD